MASYDNKLLKGDQLLVFSGLVKTALNSKADATDVPTNNNQLTNGAGYQTAADVESAITNKGYQTSAQVETAITGKGYQTSAQVESAITGKGYQTASQVSSAINAAVSQLTGFHFVIVQTLPTTNIEVNAIYLVLKTTGETGNIYTEYAYIDNKWEILGDTQVSLEYLTNAEVTQIWNTAVVS